MILKALYDYYNRLLTIDPDLPKTGYKDQEIDYIIVIDKEGNLIRIEDRTSKNGTQKFRVIADSRSRNINPYIFYDNIDYVFGQYRYSSKEGKSESDLEDARIRNVAFINKCKELANKYSHNEEFQAVVKFYENGNQEKAKQLPIWDNIIKNKTANFSFMLNGCYNIVASSSDLENEVVIENGDNKDLVPCLITGKECIPVTLTTATKIKGSQASAKLVAFQENSGYDSYGKTKCNNAPISKEAESAFTTALLRLLQKGSKNIFILGDRTFLFWSSSESEGAKALQEGIYALCNLTATKEDNPNLGVEKVLKSFKSIFSGKIYSDENDRFYILGLAPNVARLAVVFWEDTTIKDFASKILKHFDDMEVCDNRPNPAPYRGVHTIMAATTISRKSEDASPNLPEATIKSIFTGSPYPFSLYSATLRRLRAEIDKTEGLDIYYFKVRVAILKAYINRTTTTNKLDIMLDTTDTNPGYLCGRLFAVLVYAQQKANDGKDNIRARYMNSASTTPAAVFGTLLNLSIHHIDKITKGKGFIESMKGEIINLFPSSGFPSQLSIQDQGRFFVGYYHQNQAIYTKKDETEQE